MYKTGQNDSFSVVTPNFNMGDYLEETILSVLKNLQENDQYFIIDGGSSDNSLKIIKKYENNLSGWISETDNGYSHALAKGFGKSTNPFYCWINSGDLMLSGALNKARSVLTQTGADLIFGDDLYIDEKSYVLQITNGYVGNLKLAMLNGGWTPLQDACFWKASIYKEIGGVNTYLKNAADYDLFLRMSIVGNAQYSPHIYSAFRRHVSQKSVENISQYNKERRAVRARELKKVYTGNRFNQWLISLCYWIIIRWKVRIRGKKKDVSGLVGRLANEI